MGGGTAQNNERTHEKEQERKPPEVRRDHGLDTTTTASQFRGTPKARRKKAWARKLKSTDTKLLQDGGRATHENFPPGPFFRPICLAGCDGNVRVGGG